MVLAGPLPVRLCTIRGYLMNIEIHGKRWFQKTYGNTYHTARIYVGDELVVTTPIHYGYGDQYLQTAKEWLQRNGYTGDITVYSAIDVDRKKDL